MLNRKYTIKIFLLSIGSSWLVAPLGVAFLHFRGMGSNSYLLMLLLALGVCYPFQLIFNEYLSTGLVKKKFQASGYQVLLLLFMQFVLCWFLFSNLTVISLNGVIPIWDVFILSLLLAVNSWFSYMCASIYYYLTIEQRLNSKNAILIGSIPGVVFLCFYIFVGISKLDQVLIYSVFFPGLVQLIYLKKLSGFYSNCCMHDRVIATDISPPLMKDLLLAVLYLSVIALISTILRDKIALYHSQYAGIVLVSLNAFGTLVLLFGRTEYLLSKALNQSVRLIILGVAVTSLTGGVLLIANEFIAGWLALLLSMQILTVLFVIYIRNKSGNAIA